LSVWRLFGVLSWSPVTDTESLSRSLVCIPFTTAWNEIRDENNKDVDWLIAGYENGSKYDIGLLKKGSGGLEACAKELPDNEPVFGGCRLTKKGRFVSFYYCGEATSTMKKGRAGMHKNGEYKSKKLQLI